MDKWRGAAAVCINEKNELLMVLQGKTGEMKTWSVPSGGMLTGETLEQCCVRETFEETGYIIQVDGRLHTKRERIGKTDIHVDYFSSTVTGGCMQIQDPDHLIHEVRWITQHERMDMHLSFPEDQSLLMDLLIKNREGVSRT